MATGFLYVLINPSMPGLAKVGKTTRTVTNRVSELSSATGVPSPFILAFEQPVRDCDAAERWVHTSLEQAGHRHAGNREFFNAPLHEIVAIVSKAANIDTCHQNDAETDNAPLADAHEERLKLAGELYQLGCDYQDGKSVLINYAKAASYYEQAMALGHRGACVSLAILYRYGSNGLRKDLEKALNALQKAVSLGSWWWETEIAEIFLEAGQPAAARAHFNRFFELAIESYPNGTSDDDRQIVRLLSKNAANYCDVVAHKKIEHCVPDLAIKTLANDILKVINEEMEEYENHPDKALGNFMTRRLSITSDFVHSILEEVTS